MKWESVLIVTYGRSGSTLLQGILNSIDGVLIRGENDNFCYDLFNAYKKILDSKKYGITNVRHPWFGASLLNERLYIDNTKALVKRLLVANEGNVRCYGFKEIRYSDLNEKDFFEYMAFLNKIFPRVCFIFNFRNLDEVIKSKWWANDPKGSIQVLQRTENMFNKYIESNKNNCFKLNYSDMVKKSPNLKSMFDFLGAKYNERKINSTLTLKHSH